MISDKALEDYYSADYYGPGTDYFYPDEDVPYDRWGEYEEYEEE